MKKPQMKKEVSARGSAILLSGITPNALKELKQFGTIIGDSVLLVDRRYDFYEVLEYIKTYDSHLP